MNKLIKLQLRNIFHNRLFYSCLILTLILFPIISFWGTISGIQPEKNTSNATSCKIIIY